MAPAPLIVAAVSRPHPHETANGDAWAVHWHDGVCRLAVVDGLGHGPEAAAAAACAITTLAAQPHLAPVEALRACHAALGGTRGAAVSIARIDLAAACLTYAGVGNVEARLWQPQGMQRPIAYRGIVGAAIPTVRAFDLALGSDWLLVLHTDGVSARFNLARLPAFGERDPRHLADTILAEWGRATDDATVVVVAPA